MINIPTADDVRTELPKDLRSILGFVANLTPGQRTHQRRSVPAYAIETYVGGGLVVMTFAFKARLETEDRAEIESRIEAQCRAEVAWDDNGVPVPAAHFSVMRAMPVFTVSWAVGGGY